MCLRSAQNSEHKDYILVEIRHIMSTLLSKLETELKLKGFSPRTIKAYVVHNRRFLDFIQKPAEQIEEEDIKKYIAYLLSEREQKPASVSLAISALKFFYTKILKKDILKDISPPKAERKLPVVLSKREIIALIGAIPNPKHRLIIELMLSSGLRVSECVSLKKTDLDLDEKTITVRSGKGRKDRVTILSNNTAERILAFLNENPSGSSYLFPSNDGHISVKLAQKVIKQAAKRAGIQKNIFCHALRSSFATHLLENGTDIRIIQTLLGHADLSTTQVYTKVSTEQIKKVKSPLDSIL